MKSIDVKALGKAMIFTSSVILGTLVLGVCVSMFGQAAYFGFITLFMVWLSYMIFKDQRFFAPTMRFFCVDFLLQRITTCDKQQQCVKATFFVAPIFCCERQIVCGTRRQYVIGVVVLNPLFLLPLPPFFSIKKYIRPPIPHCVRGTGGGKIFVVDLLYK